MINIHDRVNEIHKHIQAEWSVVDLGCGDGYLSTLHTNTLNIDRVENNPGILKVDLNLERPDVKGDCAVLSGLLEWLDDPLSLLDWLFLNNRFKHVYFSYAGKKADPRWVYRTTIGAITELLVELHCRMTILPWEGQVLFFAHKENGCG